MSTRDLLSVIAKQMNKDPKTFEKFVDILEGEFLETEDDLRDVNEDQWKEMGIPIGLVNKIKDNLKPKQAAPIQ
jgi:hypothetical protein